MGNDLIQIASAQPCQAVAPGVWRRRRPPQTSRRGRTFYLETFGCQMNVHDSEKVAGVLMARGYRPVDSHQDADIILYNTCSIREKAAQKVFSRLGAFRQGRPGAGKIIGVLGCVAQQEGERFFRARAAGQSGVRLGELSKAPRPARPARVRQPARERPGARHRGLL